MLRLRRLLPDHEAFTVLSLNTRAKAELPRRAQTQTEVMVRHLFDRMLNNEAFGEEAAVRVTQLAYAISLPGLLVSLYLFAAYHGVPPFPLERPFWSQACDHLFFVTYAFVVMGMAAIFQWDLLFPDLLDVTVLSAMPIARWRMLGGRVAALGIFLGMVHVETSGLGNLFFPGAADLKCGFWRHSAAHAAAVGLSGGFAVAGFVGLSEMLALLPRRLGGKVAPVAKALSVVGLLTVLFLFPLMAHRIEDLVPMAWAVRWFPPAWFLGVYEWGLRGGGVEPVFRELAWRGVWGTGVTSAVAAVVYPVAYARRVRDLVEGTAQADGGRGMGWTRWVVHLAVVRTPRGRAVFHFAAQTLLRLDRLHLYLGMHAGVGLALVISSLVEFVGDGRRLRVAVSAEGAGMVVPVAVFWVVMGLRTALGSPVGRRGSWVFRVVAGVPGAEELRGASRLVAVVAAAVAVGAEGALLAIGPAELRGWRSVAGQAVLGVGLAVVLTDAAFLRVRHIPFTYARVRSTNELPWTLVLYFVLLPAFVLEVAAREAWIAGSVGHLAATAVGFVAAHAGLARVRGRILGRVESGEELVMPGLGLASD